MQCTRRHPSKGSKRHPMERWCASERSAKGGACCLPCPCVLVVRPHGTQHFCVRPKPGASPPIKKRRFTVKSDPHQEVGQKKEDNPHSSHVSDPVGCRHCTSSAWRQGTLDCGTRPALDRRWSKLPHQFLPQTGQNHRHPVLLRPLCQQPSQSPPRDVAAVTTSGRHEASHCVWPCCC